MAEKQIQWADAMSKERFHQEAALRFASILFETISLDVAQRARDTDDVDTLIDEQLTPAAKRLAKIAFAFAEQMDKQLGPDTLPRGVQR